MKKTLAIVLSALLKGRIEFLKNQFDAAGIHADEVLKKIQNAFALFTEFHAYRDYKKADEAIVDNLLWAKYAERHTMIKGPAASMAADIAAPLLIEPKQLIYLGMDARPELTAFIKDHGGSTSVSFLSDDCEEMDELAERMAEIVRKSPDFTLIDVTGAAPEFVMAASRAAAEFPAKSAVICCDPKSLSIRNLTGFPAAPAYHMNSAISAEEVFALYGASEKTGGGNYMLRLESRIEALWQYYQKHTEQWEMICTFFAAYYRRSSEVHLYNVRVQADSRWKLWKSNVSLAACRETGLIDALRKLEQIKLVRNITETDDYYNLSAER